MAVFPECEANAADGMSDDFRIQIDTFNGYVKRKKYISRK